MGVDLTLLGLMAAFAAGLLSFLSPCVAPLVPGYLSLISGATVDGRDQTPEVRRRILSASLVFVSGFSLVFVTLGASASMLGGLVSEHQRTLNQVAGIFMIVMGVFVAGFLRLPWLYRERRFQMQANRSLTTSEIMLLGMAFGFGWTPCIGPLLGSILIYTSAAQTVGKGTILLLTYSIGLGLPFIVVGFGIGRARRVMRWMTRHYQAVSLFSGATLILVGVFFLTNRMFYLSMWAQRFYYQVVEPIVGSPL